MTRALAAVGIVLLLASPGPAANGYFIPGDAFFYFELDQAEWKALQAGELTSVRYDRPEHLGFMFCGYAGYENLDLSNLSDEFRGHLVAAVASVKEKYPTKIVEIDHGEPKFFGDPSGIERKETNKLRVFVHNRSFDLSRFRIGLKYNESWGETVAGMGLDREDFHYGFFVPTPQGIAESWRMGSAVRPLAVQFPESDRRGFVREPLKIDPAKTTFLVCPPVSLTSLCFPPREGRLRCFAVSEDGRAEFASVTGNVRKSIWVESD